MHGPLVEPKFFNKLNQVVISSIKQQAELVKVNFALNFTSIFSNIHPSMRPLQADIEFLCDLLEEKIKT
jgi:hypothetical protein